MTRVLKIGDRDVLLVVDVQNDFCPKGRLPIPKGDEVVPVINRVAEKFPHIVLTQDWHPSDHLSFASSHTGCKPYDTIPLSYGPQILWPDHCVQGSDGAGFHKDLDIRRAELILRKGYRREIDSYSAFCENDHTTSTGLGGYLKDRGLSRVFVVGLALDFCVRFSAEDGARAGLSIVVVDDACRALDIDGSLKAAYESFRAHGILCSPCHEIE